MPSRQGDFVGEGAGDVLPVVEPGEAGPVRGDASLGDVPLGAVDGVPPDAGPACEPLPGRPEGLADDFSPGFAAWPPDVAGAVPPGLATPPAGMDVRDAFADGTLPRAGLPVAGDPSGSRLAAGVPLNAPETSSATRPTLATTTAPAAKAPAFRRCGDLSWPD